MKTAPSRVLIELSPGIYLDGFSGGLCREDIETTANRKTAFHQDERGAKRRLTWIINHYPQAKIVPATR
jgi:hypothetical protein